MTAATIPRGAAGSLRRNPSSAWRHLDPVLIGATLAVACLGTIMVFSATRHGMAAAGLDPATYLKRQLVWLVVGSVVMVAVAAVDYRRWRELGPVAYGIGIVLLVLVISPLGTRVNGAQSWFAIGSFQLQPGELIKPAVIMVLASYVARTGGALDGGRLLVALSVAAVPAALILLQPDFGTMLVMVVAAAAVVVVGGARPRHLAALTLVSLVGVIGVFQTGVVDDYQRDRITVFANQGDRALDVQGVGWNLAQAKTAIAVGHWTGVGLFEGTQTRLGFVPEQSTDFIFTVVGEELGFAGSATLLLMYAVLVWRTWRAAQLAKDLYGTLLCTGVLALLLFHVFQNVGMTMGIMPVTGIPLPFMSYGGSSTIVAFAAVGLVLNVHMRRFS